MFRPGLCLKFVLCFTPNASYSIVNLLAVLGLYDTLIILVYNNNKMNLPPF